MSRMFRPRIAHEPIELSAVRKLAEEIAVEARLSRDAGEDKVARALSRTVRRIHDLIERWES